MDAVGLQKIVSQSGICTLSYQTMNMTAINGCANPMTDDSVLPTPLVSLSSPQLDLQISWPGSDPMDSAARRMLQNRPLLVINISRVA
ncbi:MAG: hypothetical protein A3K53_01480 [Deltaproteobacteria bacterium RIFOXYB2_FULL_66_7]|nr:MAG: hypothetical protein A3K53_01480 [Deltaproteobacteria bacterium RIFOXYB2_FULL_66_7]